jgi:hypothetical protein
MGFGNRSCFWCDKFSTDKHLVRPAPLNYWSDITLVAWDVLDLKDYEIYKALSSLSKQPKIRLIEADEDYLTVEEENAIAR